MKNVVIIGHGTVGRATCKLLDTPYWEDRYEKSDSYWDSYDFAVICVKEEDLEEALKRAHLLVSNDKNIIIRTTIDPNNAHKYTFYTLWPEFNVTETRSKGSNLVVMTHNDDWRNYLLSRIDAHTKINVMDHKTVCASKVLNNYRLLEEARLAFKLHDLTEAYGVEYDTIRNIFLEDGRRHDNWTGEIKSNCFDLAEKIIKKLTE